ncbi:MAG: MFS transporter [Candidatus Lokiarchaeota archaeon]|nr:MFS transporter [Candidatus Lokiarchaeota archaeon]
MKEKKVHSYKGYLLYSLGAVPSALPYNMIQSYFVLFYTTKLGLDLELAGIMLIIYGVWNAINDPLIGYLMDKKKTRWGRRIPYIIVGTIPLTIGFILLWIVPWKSTNLIFIHGLIMLFLFDLGFTFAMTAWSALYTEMYEDEGERATVVAIKDFVAFLSSMIGILIPTMIADALGWGYAGLILGSLIPITMLLSLLGSKEREEYQIDEPLSLFPALKATFTNVPFVIITLTYALIDYIFGLTMTVLPLYATFILELEEGLVGLSAAGVAIGIIVAIPFWRWIYTKRGPKFGLMLAIILFGSTIWLVFFGTNFSHLLVISIFPGFGASGMLMTEPAISTAIDYDELRTGKRREASYNGILTLVARLSIVFTGLTLIIVKYFTGFDPDNIIQFPRALNGLRSLITIVPVVTIGITAIVFVFFPINLKKFKVMQETLKELHKERRKKIE